jgi:hypothetical protein
MATASAPTVSRSAPRPRLRHAVEVAETLLIAAIIAAIATLLMQVRAPTRSELDVAQRPGPAAPSRV